MWNKYAKKLKKSVPALALMFVIGSYVFFPTMANADMTLEQIRFDDQTIALIIDSMKNKTKPYGHLPMSENASARRTYQIPVTAYTSEVGQTDDTPCITASGLDVCKRDTENIVATNFLPLGTRVRMPELYGDRVFYVEDRMNGRYHYKMDVWMKEKEAAKQFGVQYTTIEVF
jgi:3D (Asp-Asp-Asp) domain-containing protein